jgi:ribosomal protein S11
MALKLGNTDALLYLGSQIADRAYLGTVQVPRVLYFDGTEDDDWDEIGNWWFDAAHTVAATSLPTAADSVVASANITASGQTVVNFTLNDPISIGFLLSGTLTATGNATFNDSSINFGPVTGNATFNSSSGNNGTVTGDATFNNDSFNDGTVNGNATFNDSSLNFGTVTGDATFNSSSGNNGTVTGDATFNDSSGNNGTVTGTVTCNTTGSCTPT